MLQLRWRLQGELQLCHQCWRNLHKHNNHFGVFGHRCLLLLFFLLCLLPFLCSMWCGNSSVRRCTSYHNYDNNYNSSYPAEDSRHDTRGIQPTISRMYPITTRRIQWASTTLLSTATSWPISSPWGSWTSTIPSPSVSRVSPYHEFTDTIHFRWRRRTLWRTGLTFVVYFKWTLQFIVYMLYASCCELCGNGCRLIAIF